MAQLKKEVESTMEEQEKLSIEQQIEYLKNKLVEAEQTQNEQEQEPVELPNVQEVVYIAPEVEQKPVEEAPNNLEVEESRVAYKEMGLVELKQVIQELLTRI